MSLMLPNRPLAQSSNRSSTTLSRLATYVMGVSAAKLSETTLQSVRDCVLDCVTAAIAGSDEVGARAARAVSGSAFGTGPSSVWFSGTKVPASAAVLANCNAASILDLDDGHRAATGHPGAAIIPACLAVAEEVDASWEELAVAIVVGYEVAVRVAAGRDFSRLDTMSTGKWCNYGVAAAVGRLRGLDHGQLVQAMAIAGVHGPNQSAAGYSKVMGNHAKEGIPWSTLTGILAVDLAANGFTGPTDILDHHAYFEASNIVRGLGRSSAIERVYFKPYSCCRWAHAAIDGLTDILEHDGLRVDAVEQVEVHTFARALKLNNDTDPDTLEGAQYSVPFVLGVAAQYGREALLPLSQQRLHDEKAVNFARRVSLFVDPALDNRFPETTAARIILKTATGQHMREVLYPLGDPDNPMARDKLTEKFDVATRNYETSAFKAAFHAFDAGDYRPLIALLQQPLTQIAAAA
ncbi:MAG: MmgE/PrpD family protein [Devosia sp.]|nr:MmgE/PrpD family protein [Devosia sp.]